ncbi:trypsin-like peptidase domain-containing protein [Schinkia azotoformans]|uniref:S1C family serine protease n=1 Tax=Schinkia azotoformans TaxID=1454 RepID=UPI002E206415|nr:trypsin-like peptidase domain-containing protein [Schinkia azotoformans]
MRLKLYTIGTFLFILFVPYIFNTVIPVNKKLDSTDPKNKIPSSIETNIINSLTIEEKRVNSIKEASEAVVGIISFKQEYNIMDINQSTKTGIGTGFIFKKDSHRAYILTNNHVIEGAQKIIVELNPELKLEAKIIGSDPLTDLAVIEIPSKGIKSTLRIGDSDKVLTGQSVIAIGNPLGLSFSDTATLGIVSSVSRTIDIQTIIGPWFLEVIQTDAAINPGNSGGPLINLDGEVIGITSLKITSSGVEGLGFAIPINKAMVLANNLISEGEVKRPFIGLVDPINVEYLSNNFKLEFKLPNDIDKGVMVQKIVRNSPADKAGVKYGDVIIKVNDTDIKDLKNLRQYLFEDIKLNEKAKLTIIRDGTLLTKTIFFDQKLNINQS